MIVCHTRKFIFIHIHKTAGDSITTALRPCLDRTDFVLGSDVQMWVQKKRVSDENFGLLPLRKHSPAMVVRDHVSDEIWQEYYKFAFVRDPIDRALSLYHYVLRKSEERRRFLPRNAWYLTPMGRRTDPLNWPAVRAANETDSFSSFIRHPLAQRDPAMRPQMTALCDEAGNVLVDFVGHFERLNEDFNLVRSRLGLPETVVTKMNASNNSAVKRLTIPEEDKELLTARFASDLTRFY